MGSRTCVGKHSRSHSNAPVGKRSQVATASSPLPKSSPISTSPTSPVAGQRTLPSKAALRLRPTGGATWANDRPAETASARAAPVIARNSTVVSLITSSLQPSDQLSPAPKLLLRLRRRRKRGFIGRLGNREPDPHPSGTMTGHSAEDEEGSGLPRHEPDIGALAGREALFHAPGRSVFERRWHGTDGDHFRIGDHFHRVGQGRVLVLEMK